MTIYRLFENKGKNVYSNTITILPKNKDLPIKQRYINIAQDHKSMAPTLWPLFMDGAQLTQGYRATTSSQFTLL